MVTIEHYARVVASVYDAAVSRDWAPALTAIHRMFAQTVSPPGRDG